MVTRHSLHKYFSENVTPRVKPLGVFLRAHLWQAVAALVVIVAAGSFIVHRYTVSTPAYGGTFTEGSVGTLSLVNPVLATNEADKQAARLVFSPLSDLLATSSVTYTKTQQVWHMTLRDDAMWEDGKPITPEDVFFTIHAIQDPQSNSPLAPSWESVVVERAGGHDLTFTAPLGYGYFRDTLMALAPLPLHIYQPLPYSSWTDAGHALAPVGSGPFRFMEKTVKDGAVAEYKLEAVASSKSENSNKPFIKNFTWKFFATTDEMVKEFNRGGVDGMVLLDPATQDTVHAPHVNVNFMLQNYYAIFPNPGKNEALRDIHVREALQQSLHKDDALKIVPGATWFMDGIADASSPGSDASTLLLAGGWMKNGSVWTKKTDKTHSIELRVTLTVPDILFLKQTAEYAKQQWEAIGVPTKIEVVPVDTLTSETIPNRTYELLLFGNIVSPPYDLFPFWHSSERFHPGLNLALYSDKQVDAALQNIRAAATADDRAALYERVKIRLASDAAAIFLYQTPYTYVTGSRVHSVEGGAIAESADRFDGVRAWYVKKARSWK